MRTPSAYTLFECLLVVSIVTILAVSSYPSLQHWFEARQEQSLQQTLLHAFRFAEQQSRILNVAVVICPQQGKLQCGEDWMQGLLVYKDEYSDNSLRDRDQVLSLVSLPATHGRLQWEGYPYYQPYIKFMGEEGWGSVNGSLRYYRHKTTLAWSVVINKVGNARISIAQ